jgi:hypothetical protein
MNLNVRAFRSAHKLLSGSILYLAVIALFAQVSPNEIQNPKAKSAEDKYFAQLLALHRAIDETHFPFPVKLARYLNAKPGQRGAQDASGIEFVGFQGRIVLKISLVYNAEYNVRQLSRNQCAGRAFQEAVAPILRVVAEQMPQTADYDSIGVELTYGRRDDGRSYDFAGKESLTVLFTRDDAVTFSKLGSIAERQKILNRSEVYLSGEEFGLALGQRDPLLVAALDRTSVRQAENDPAPVPDSTSSNHADIVTAAYVSPTVSIARPTTAQSSPLTFADAMRLQAQFQVQLDGIVREDGKNLHLAEGKAPSFEVAGDQTLLHFTMQNALSFDRNIASIYKRAAQSFDLFLAPELKSLSRRLPVDQSFDAIEFSVLNQSGTGQASIETIDYICPLTPLREFVANRITSQDLINQSVVLVNGIRIGLNLQLVE